MGTFIKDKTFKDREEMRDYVHGLIRHEILKGEDDDRRLQVLSQIYHDLLYKEDLRDSPNWKKNVKGKDELSITLDKLVSVTEEVNNYKNKLEETLEYINPSRTKKEIIDFVDKLKK